MYALRCSFFESICTQQLIFFKVYCNRPFSRGSHTLIGLKLHIIISNLNFVLSWILARGAVDESKGATVVPGTNMWTKYYLDPCPLDAWNFSVLSALCGSGPLKSDSDVCCRLRLSARKFCQMKNMLWGLGLSPSTPAGVLQCALRLNKVKIIQNGWLSGLQSLVMSTGIIWHYRTWCWISDDWL